MLARLSSALLYAAIAGMDALSLQALGGWASQQMVAYYTEAARDEAALNRAREVNLTERLLG